MLKLQDGAGFGYVACISRPVGSSPVSHRGVGLEIRILHVLWVTGLFPTLNHPINRLRDKKFDELDMHSVSGFSNTLFREII